MSRLIRFGNGDDGANRLNNQLTNLLGCEYPIMLAGMGGVSRYRLAAAVANAGGFGCMGMVREEPALIRDEVIKFRQLSAAPFGVNLIPSATKKSLLEMQLETCIEIGVPIVVLFWEIDIEVIARLKRAGIKVIYQVGRGRDAQLAIDAGVDALIVQGNEAGGHVRGNTPLLNILAEISKYATVPLVAAGGISRGLDLVNAMNLGASGVCCGTLFLATEESNAHEFHKQLIVQSSGEDTVITDKFWRNWHEPAPVRVLKCCLNNINKVLPGLSRVIALQDGKPVYLYSTDSPLSGASGQLELMALYAGKSCSGIQAVEKVSVVMNRFLHEAGLILGSDRNGHFSINTREPVQDAQYPEGACN